MTRRSKCVGVSVLNLALTTWCAAATPAAAPGSQTTGAPERASLVLVNATVLTLDASDMVAQAIAIQGNRILAVGKNDDMRKVGGAAARVIDLKGKTILPGFIDSRVNGPFGYWEWSAGVRLADADGSPLGKFEDVEAAVKTWIAAHKPTVGQWLVAAGFDPRLAASRKFDRELADRAAPDHPLLMLSFDHRAALLNGKGIEALDLKTAAKNWGADVGLDAKGDPTGLVREGPVFRVMNRVWEQVPERTRHDSMQVFLDAATRSGITTVGVPLAVPADLATAETLIKAGEMPAHMVFGAYGANEEARQALDAYARDQRSPDPDRLSIGPPLYFLDGTPFAWRAALFQPYEDAPWTAGLLSMSPENIGALFDGQGARSGGAILDASGSLAVHLLLDASERARHAEGEAHGAALLMRADGLNVIAPSDRARLASLASSGLVVTVQPTRLPYRVYLTRAIGDGRADQALSCRTLVDAGVPLAINSDWPMTSQTFQPTQVMEWAVTRTGWRPEEGLTIPQALRAYTSGAARALLLQDRVGTIEVGKRADLVVLDQNPLDLAATPDGLSDILVRMTISSGEVVFEDRKSPAPAPARAAAARSATTPAADGNGH